MKKILYSIAMITLAMACKKTDNKDAIKGYWTGTGLPSGTTVADFLGFLYDGNGNVRAYSSNSDTNAAVKANGTYSIGTDSVRTSIISGSAITQYSASLNSASTQMTGTFRRTTINYHGTYTVTKQ
ncbi:MAG: hypothetical protein JWN78_800 [Bacteroidota bacterium]|nr:hypothetical protein [Bacteroidota bacterium]